MITLDANVLVYAADKDAGERHRVSVDLVSRALGVPSILTLQSLAEFSNAVVRKGRLDPAMAHAFVEDWLDTFSVVAADTTALLRAHALRLEHGVAFWDAMLIATAMRAGCEVLLSEDLQDGRWFGRLQILNPFEAANTALIDALLPA